jgi:hypothetical protein
MKEVCCSHPQERQWIDLALAGDLSAFKQLIQIYQDAVFRTAKWMVNDHASAEDIVQTIFLTAYRQMNTIRSNYFRAWLLRMALPEDSVSEKAAANSAEALWLEPIFQPSGEFQAK